MRTRQEHIEFCKCRALALLDAGEVDEAVSSMMSDLGKHPETRPSQQFAFMFRMSDDASDPVKVRRFINGFN